jgi:hypothetical protein
MRFWEGIGASLIHRCRGLNKCTGATVIARVANFPLFDGSILEGRAAMNSAREGERPAVLDVTLGDASPNAQSEGFGIACQAVSSACNSDQGRW